MTSPQFGPSYAPVYESSFDVDRVELGLEGRNFDYFFRAVEAFVCDHPFEFSTPVPGGDGIRIAPTRRAFPDIPPLYIYFRVEERERRVVFLGMSPAWSQRETTEGL